MRLRDRLLMVCTALALAGCPAADDVAETSDSDDPSGGTSDGEFECDPMGANPAMGELLNAPVEDDVEVIVKVPQHPGNPGPDNLP